MRIILGGMGGMMDKLGVIIKSYCEMMILIEYEKARDNVLYENLKIENKQEEIIKRKYVQEKLNGKKKRWKPYLKNNFGLSESFDLNNYSYEEVVNFLYFFEKYILDNPNDILRMDRAIGTVQPNQKIMLYTKTSEIKHNYEKLYNYILEYRNKFYPKRVNAYFSIYGIRNLENYFNAEVRCINEIMSYKMIWKGKLLLALKSLLLALEQCARYAGMDNIKYWDIFAWCEIMEDGILQAITAVLQETRGLAYPLLTDMLNKVTDNIDDILESAIIRNYNKDIFQDYGINYILCAESNECEIILEILEKLTQIGKIKEGKDKRKTHDEKARKVGTFLIEVLGKLIDLNDERQIEAIIDEIYFRDREFNINIDGKNKKYLMPSLANNLLNMKNIRSEETIILCHKIQRGIDCYCYGNDYYLKKNELFRKFYAIKSKLFEPKDRDSDYIRKLPYYLQRVIMHMIEAIK